MTVESVDAGPKKVRRSAVVAATPEVLFEIVAHPRQHRELDGSNTVGATITGPDRLSTDARFTTRMKQLGLPYRITSQVTEFEEARVIEWRHPAGHRWRWEFVADGEGSSRVTETFDYSALAGVQSGFLRLVRVPKQNAAGIEATLRRLQSRFAPS